MTMPYMMNCQHLPDGTCTKCLAELIHLERERFLRLLELNDSTILLMAGEMSAQELRTVRAVLNGLKARY